MDERDKRYKQQKILNIQILEHDRDGSTIRKRKTVLL